MQHKIELIYSELNLAYNLPGGHYAKLKEYQRSLYLLIQ